MEFSTLWWVIRIHRLVMESMILSAWLASCRLWILSFFSRLHHFSALTAEGISVMICSRYERALSADATLLLFCFEIWSRFKSRPLLSQRYAAPSRDNTGHMQHTNTNRKHKRTLFSLFFWKPLLKCFFLNPILRHKSKETLAVHGNGIQ